MLTASQCKQIADTYHASGYAAAGKLALGFIGTIKSSPIHEWLESAPSEIKEFLASPVAFKFLVDQRNISFQMPGAYDGSMSEECKALFRNQHTALSQLVDAVNELSERHPAR